MMPCSHHQPQVPNKTKPSIDEIGIYKFFTTGAPNPPGLEGIEEDKLLKIQKNIQDTLKERVYKIH